jgi:hypothetical protein
MQTAKGKASSATEQTNGHSAAVLVVSISAGRSEAAKKAPASAATAASTL